MMAHDLTESCCTEELRPAPRRGFTWLAVGTIGILTTLVYAQTFHVPWYLDDLRTIVENQHLRNLSWEFRHLLFGRGLSEFGFALNYHLGGLAVVGYHLVNLLIHIGSAVLVYLLLLRGCRLHPGWALAGGLTFALHPLQTQAVTYVVQRMTSQAGFFFLLACLLYLVALDAPRSRAIWFTAAWLAGAAAVLSKESALVLPVALWLCERYWRPGRSGRMQALTVLPFCLVPAWKVAEEVLLPLWNGTGVTALGHLDQLAILREATPLHYLVTEFSVTWLYLRLLLLPYGQALEYDWPIVSNLLTIQNIVAGLGLAGLITIAWKLRRRRPLLSLGIAWFLLTLSVESTLIPLDPVFEHRLYLPMFGFILVLLDGASALRPGRWRQGLAVGVLLVLGLLAWQRNRLWTDPVALYEDSLHRHPFNERACDELANCYVERQQFAAAEQTLRAGLDINPGYPRLWNSLGLLHARLGAFDQAIAAYRRAIAVKPDYYLAYSNLGVALAAGGHWAEALEYYRQALALHDNAKTRFHAGVAWYNLGRYEEASEELRRAVRLNPEQVKAVQLLGAALQHLDRGDEARQVQAQLASLDGRKAAERKALLRAQPD